MVRSRSLPALDSKVDLNPLFILLQNTVVLAQRVPLPAVGKKNALQVGMAVELNPEHIEDLSLQPVGGAPDRDAGRDRSAVGDLRLDPHPLVARKRIKDPNQIELLLPLGIVHS